MGSFFRIASLFFVCGLYAISPPYFSQNRELVADNINTLSAQGLLTPGLASINGTLNTLDTSIRNEALDELHPAPYSSFVEIQASVGGQLLSLFHRGPTLECCDGSDRPWISWTGNWLKEENKGQQTGFTSATQGVAAGYDWTFGSEWSFGAGLAWDHTYFYLQRGRGDGQVNRYLGALYSDFEMDCFYAGLSFYGGMDANHLRRRIQFSSTDLTAKGNFNSLDLGAQFATSYLFRYKTFLLSPYASVDYLYFDAGRFTEIGADGASLEVASHGSGTIRSFAGLSWQMLDSNLEETICVAPLIALGWSMVCPVGRPFYNAAFADEPLPFQTKGWNQTWQLLALDFRLAMTFFCYRVLGEYYIEFAPKGGPSEYCSQRANLSFDYSW